MNNTRMGEVEQANSLQVIWHGWKGALGGIMMMSKII